MQHRLISVSIKNRDMIDYTTFLSSGTNESDICKMKSILHQAIKCELTDRQRECLVMYYYDNKRIREIASLLSLSRSTVSRHIKAAKRKLQSVAKYY